MFCPSCGTESAGLKYCNRCGANLSSPLATPAIELAPISLTKPILMMGAILLFVTLGGFAGIISGTVDLVQAGAANMSPALPIFGFPCILTIDILLIRQLSKLISAALSTNQLPAPKSLPQAPYDPRLAPPMTARLESVPSVTENTTRFLKSDYRAPGEPQPAEKQNP